MSYMIGADVQELRDLAAAFRAKAGQLRTMESNLNYRINSAPWHGHDVTKFVHDWNSSHRRQILNVAAQIEAAAGTVSANADQQAQASQAGYTGGIPSVETFRRLEKAGVMPDLLHGLAPLLAAGGGILGTAASIALVDAYTLARGVNDVGFNLLSVVDGPRSMMEAVARNTAREEVMKNLERWKGTLTEDTVTDVAKNASRDVSETVEVGGKMSRFMAVAGKVMAPVGMVFSAVDLYNDFDNHESAAKKAWDGGGVVLGALGTAVAFGAIANPVGVAVIGAVGIGYAVTSLAMNPDVQHAVGAATKWASSNVASVAKSAAHAYDDAKKNVGRFIKSVTSPLKVFGW